MKKSSMRVLLIDIETAPGVAYIWSLWDKFIPIDRLIKPGYTLCWAAKWLGSSDIMFRSIYHDGKDVMLQELYDILSSADAVITFNGDKFDIPTINREFLEAGITPPSPAHSVDLYKTVKRRFRLMSNKLDFVCQTLGIGGKVKHKGMALWYECMSGVDKSWNKMRIYNRRDVVLLEKLYKYLLPWIQQHPNHALFTDKDRPVCTNCGSHHVQSRGIQTTKTLEYKRYHCQNCGNWMRERTTCSTKQTKARTLVKV